jgi:hypothetical protein
MFPRSIKTEQRLPPTSAFRIWKKKRSTSFRATDDVISMTITWTAPILWWRVDYCTYCNWLRMQDRQIREMTVKQM